MEELLLQVHYNNKSILLYASMALICINRINIVLNKSAIAFMKLCEISNNLLFV